MIPAWDDSRITFDPGLGWHCRSAWRGDKPKGEIRIADRAYRQPDRIASVLEQGADIVVRAAWRNARWLDANGEPVDLLAEFRKALDCGLIDRPIFIGRKSGKRLPCASSPSESPDKPPKPRGGRRADRRESGAIRLPKERSPPRNG